MLKYNFSVKTRDGSRIGSIQIYGKDQPDAERKLNQMYRYCEILSCNAIKPCKRIPPALNANDMLPRIAEPE